MGGPHPAVAQLRTAVRQCLADLEPGDLVLAACSGGADSLALAASLAFVAPRQGLRAGAVTVDHGLQPGSAGQAARAAAQLTGLGLAPVEVIAVTVGAAGGPEAAARDARYLALDQAGAKTGAAAILLGHTRDDQAETVLLGLARGSGGRSLAGMPERTGRYRRPLLGLGRDQTRAACDALGLRVWEDPQNADPRYARARVRHQALPALEASLGPGVAAALARTARQLRADADALDQLAADAAARLRGDGQGMDVAGLTTLPAALRTRVLRAAAIEAGCPPGSLGAAHIDGLDALITGWRGQRGVDLPGGIRGERRYGKLRFIVSSPAREQALKKSAVQDSATHRQCRPRQGRPRQGRARMDASDMGADLKEVLISPEQLRVRIGELAAAIDADYAGRELLLVGVLKGAVMVLADLARAMHLPAQMDWMAVSSYGSGTKSSGVVRILKDLDTDITGRHVLVVEDIIDSGLTLSWLVGNLRSRGPASVEVCCMLRKPAAARMDVEVRYTGFDIADEFVIGYGLDYAEKFRNLPFIGTLAPHVYGGAGNTSSDQKR
jgi:tRNA(Ile)-lysidine synthase